MKQLLAIERQTLPRTEPFILMVVKNSRLDVESSCDMVFSVMPLDCNEGVEHTGRYIRGVLGPDEPLVFDCKIRNATIIRFVQGNIGWSAANSWLDHVV
jgi:hypothetical protein